ncbi:TolC family protein [Candidatus Poribacteria bacterium]|nr:TolC family protein [Candidatus Poribacteria bacterium]
MVRIESAAEIPGGGGRNARKTPPVLSIFCLLILCLLCVPTFSDIEEAEKQMELSLQNCITLALKSNLNIRIQRISPQIQDALVTMAQGRFDPSLTFNPNVNASEEPSPTPFLSGADVRTSNTQATTLSLDDPIATGGSYGLSFNSNRSESNSRLQTLNPAYRSGLTLSATQPLLEGFGAVNKASIAIARNNKDISVLRLKAQLIQTLSEVQDTYWELVFAQENLKVQQLALKRAQDLLTINQRRKEVGKSTLSDVLQAQAAVASREADVIAAQDVVKDVEDRLKGVTNMIQDESIWNVSILPVGMPAFEAVKVDLQESLAQALQNRPEYAQAKIDLENSDISIKVAKNQRLPRLDLEGTLAFNGLGGDVNDPLSQVGKREHGTWRAGLFLHMPIGGRGTKAALKRTQLEKEQGLLALQDLEQQIITQVRGAVRQLETDSKRIDATKAAEEFARQALLAEEKKYELGLSTSHDLLQFQAELATTTRNHLRSVIDYRQSIVALYQASGVTLEELNIQLE